MSQVEFSDEESLPTARADGAKSGTGSGLMGLVVKIGLARDVKGASTALLIIALIVAAAAVSLLLFGLP